MKPCPFFSARVHCGPCRSGAGTNGFPIECPHADQEPWLDTEPEPVERPGTALKAILEAMYIKEREGCQCGALARQMDRWGCDECSRRVEEIVTTMRTEAKKRWPLVPFIPRVAAAIVRMAIARERAKAHV